LLEPALEQGDGGAEVIGEGQQQVDVVEVVLAAETMGEVVAWVDGGTHVAAVRAEEAEIAFAHLGRRPRAAQGGDGDRHRQVVAQAAEQVRSNHGLIQIDRYEMGEMDFLNVLGPGRRQKRMIVRDLPAWLRLKACSMRRRSHLKAELSNSTRKASQRILTVLV
jgi:hypothetical protein